MDIERLYYDRYKDFVINKNLPIITDLDIMHFDNKQQYKYYKHRLNH